MPRSECEAWPRWVVPLSGRIVTVEIRLPGALFAVPRLGSRRAMRRWCPSGRVGLLGSGRVVFCQGESGSGASLGVLPGEGVDPRPPSSLVARSDRYVRSL